MPFAQVPTENPLWGEDWAAVRALWPLDPSVAHLNHGSFGAIPTRVQQAQDGWRRRAAENPMRYWLLDEPHGTAAARARAAAFLGADPDAVALVPNATTAVSTVLAAVGLTAGDEVVVTDHGYGAVRMALDRTCSAVGARVVAAPVDVHASDDLVRAAVARARTDATRLVVLDHITSPTAKVLPVAEVAADLRVDGVPLLVDAAHAPGQLPLDLAALDADFWTGNFHKWPAAARGTAALVVAQRWQERVLPLVTSWNLEAGFPGAFDLTGTQDQSAWLALGDALDLMDELSWPRLREHGSALAAYGQQVLADTLGIPERDLWSDDRVWMRCIPLPPEVGASQAATRSLWQRISDDLGCEVGVTSWRGRAFLRISAHAYNAPVEYERLAVGLRDLL